MLAVILNENSGDGPQSNGRADRVRAALDRAGIEAEIRVPEADELLEGLARRCVRDGERKIVAAGGDGTVSAVAGPCCEAGVPLGVIPMGTFNFFARANGIPLDTDDAVQLLAGDAMRDVRLGTVNGRFFLNNVSVGLYPSILETREDVYDRLGRSRPAAYWSVLKCLVLKPDHLTLQVRLGNAWQDIRTPLAFVANSAYQLDRFQIDGARELRAGKFALLTAPPASRGTLLRVAWRIARGRARKGSDFTLHTAQDIEITWGRRRFLVACDGERARMTAPLRIAHSERPLHLIAPAPA